jgi:integrase/recombinase XerD
VVSFHGSPPCLHDRFLDFLVREGSIASNPVAELRTKYCVKGSETILRALLAPEPDRALDALRQLPRFGSVLGDLMRNHVALMRTRGFRYDTQTRMFLRFDRSGSVGRLVEKGKRRHHRAS